MSINVQLSTCEKLLLPIYTPFAVRHLKKDNWRHKVIGAIEFFPGISLIASLIELIIHHCFTKKNLIKNNKIENVHRLKKEDAPIENNEPRQQGDELLEVKKQAQRVIVVANKQVFMQHSTGMGHPESPKRVEAIENGLREAHLMNDKNTLKPREAQEDEIALCHSPQYMQELTNQLDQLQTKPDNYSQTFDKYQESLPEIPGDFQISKNTLKASLYAAGAPLTAIDYILDPENKTNRAFCIVRPPGHHAHQHTGSGFCVFNNVAIGAKYLAKMGYKTAIVDWDAHHGDGTQELTEKDQNIFYFSTHKDTSNGFYPGRRWGCAEETGLYNNVMNCPVSGSANACREGILKAFERFEAAMDQFKPDFILISCGFDAHKDDVLVGLGLHDEDYKTMTQTCIHIADKYAKGRIVSVLEGGYNLEAISNAARAHVETLSEK